MVNFIFDRLGKVERFEELKLRHGLLWREVVRAEQQAVRAPDEKGPSEFTVPHKYWIVKNSCGFTPFVSVMKSAYSRRLNQFSGWECSIRNWTSHRCFLV